MRKVKWSTGHKHGTKKKGSSWVQLKNIKFTDRRQEANTMQMKPGKSGNKGAKANYAQTMRQRG